MSLDKQAQSTACSLLRWSRAFPSAAGADEVGRVRSNPLAEDEAQETRSATLGKSSAVHGLPTASSSRRTSLEDDGEPGEDAAAMAAFEAKFMRGPAAAPAGAPSGAIGLNVNSSELDDLVRLKNLVMAHDVTGEQHSTLPPTTSHHITTHTPFISPPHRRWPRPR